MKKHDVIVIGGGPGGSTLSAYLARAGYDVAVFERESYPRFHIGESLLPACMEIFKETGFFETLDSGKYIKKFGARFLDYRSQDEIYFGFENGFNQNIPFAFEVERAKFDKDILEHSKKCGATVYQPERIKTVEFFDTHVKVTTNKDEYEAQFIADASGRDSFLGKQFKMKQRNQDLNNVAVFSHFTGVKRHSGKDEGDIVIGLLPNQAWTWIIPFQGEHTSVGVVCNANVFRGGTDLAEYMKGSMSSSSILQSYMEKAERTQEIQMIANYSHRSEAYAGDRWILIGDSAIFLDPIFSSGVHMSCSSARFATEMFKTAFEKGVTLKHEGMHQKYFEDLNRGVERFHGLISMFYHSNFVESMKKTLQRENMRQAYTSALAGDVWNEDNVIFKMRVV